jgi:hypothetical protein
MDRFNVMANTVRLCLVGLADWLSGCSHRRRTFPITLRASATVDGLSVAAKKGTSLAVEKEPAVRLRNGRFDRRFSASLSVASLRQFRRSVDTGAAGRRSHVRHGPRHGGDCDRITGHSQ